MAEHYLPADSTIINKRGGGAPAQQRKAEREACLTADPLKRLVRPGYLGSEISKRSKKTVSTYRFTFQTSARLVSTWVAREA
jgi:hypothetical protein